MIDKRHFDIIHDFCKNRKTSSVDEKILLHMFYTEYFELLEKQETSKGEISEQEMAGYEKSLLSETNLMKNMRIAESERENLISEKINKIEVKYKFKNIGLTILLNVVSSLLSIFVLMLILAAARNQIKPILQDIFVNPIITIDRPQE
jgi:hypothetical protein